MRSRLHPETVLYGLCVKIEIVGKHNNLKEAIDGAGDKHCDTQACATCGALLKFLEGKWSVEPYKDQAKARPKATK